MKWLLGLFVSLFLLVPNKGFAANRFLSKFADNQVVSSALSLKADSTKNVNVCYEFKNQLSTPNSNNQSPQKNKKSRKKGFKSVCCCLSVSCLYFLIVSDNENYFFKQNSLIACVFFGNGKRGPPSLLV